MSTITLSHFIVAVVSLLILPSGSASGDSPRAKAPSKGAESRQSEKRTGRPVVPAKTPAEIETELKQAELERRAAKAETDAAVARAIAEEQFNKLDPRIKNLIDPEINAAQYELVETCLKEYPPELLDTVDKAFRDDVVRLSELATVESRWETAAKPRAKERAKALIHQLRSFPGIAPDRPDLKPRAASFEGDGSIELAIVRGKLPTDKEMCLRGLRAELVKAAIRGAELTADERAKLAAFFSVKPDALGKLETELHWEARAPELEEIERYLRLHPAELLKHVEKAYQDDKVTYLEYEVVKAVKEETELTAAKARLKAKILELFWDGRK